MLDETKTKTVIGRVIIQKMPKLFAVTVARELLSKSKKEDPNIPCFALSSPWQSLRKES